MAKAGQQSTILERLNARETEIVFHEASDDVVTGADRGYEELSPQVRFPAGLPTSRHGRIS